MTIASQLDDLTTALRRTRGRLLAPLDHRQHQLPTDPEVFVDDVLHYVMDQWAEDLRAEGHVLQQDLGWKDEANHYPRYELRMAGGEPLHMSFTGDYPRSLYLTFSKAFRRSDQFSDAKQVQVQLRVSTDPNILLHGLLEGLRNVGKP
ncbi:MAG: hypothetical protein IPK99_01835 [Flavobacteriales bacterium]|nr:hypothetical protein [Flavobacteriales bacterium]